MEGAIGGRELIAVHYPNLLGPALYLITNCARHDTSRGARRSYFLFTAIIGRATLFPRVGSTGQELTATNLTIDVELISDYHGIRDMQIT